MTNEIVTLKQKCENSKNDLERLSVKTVALCEDIINVCNERKNMFGEAMNDGAKAEVVSICYSRIKEIDSLSKNALENVLTIYNSVMKFSEIRNTAAVSFNNVYFFSLIGELGGAFERIFEREIPSMLNDIIKGLDLDNNGVSVDMHLVISSAAKIAISVSKATKFYFSEE